MAWFLRVVDVTYIEVGDPNADPPTEDVDLSETGRYKVFVEYYDDGDPATILLTADYVFHDSRTSANQALVEAKDYGEMVRDARDTVDQLSTHIGTSYPLDPPV